MESLTYPWVDAVLRTLPVQARELPRALMISGRPGLGKRASALFLAQGLLCEMSRNELKACGTCPSCRLYQAGNHPDLRMLEVGQEEDLPAGTDDEEAGKPKKESRQILVDKIRSVSDFVGISAHRGGAKVICIVPAEAMHPAAANALLKILEEPPGNTFFLLVTHQPERLLPTIRSRCFKLAFALPDAAPALEWLKTQGVARRELALAQGGYAPLAALDRANDDAFWLQRKSLLDAIATAQFDPLRAADYAEDMDTVVVSTLLSKWAFDLASLWSGGEVRYHLDYNEYLRNFARRVSGQEIMGWYAATIQFGRSARHPLNKRLAMESVLSAYPAG